MKLVFSELLRIENVPLCRNIFVHLFPLCRKSKTCAAALAGRAPIRYSEKSGSLRAASHLSMRFFLLSGEMIRTTYPTYRQKSAVKQVFYTHFKGSYRYAHLT